MIYLAYVRVFVIIAVIVKERKEMEVNEQITTAKNKYLNHPMAQELARRMGESAIQKIKAEKREIWKPEIKCYFSVKCGIVFDGYCHNITSIGIGDYYFGQDKKPLLRDDAIGLCWAIAIMSRQYVLNHLTQDPSGTRYILSSVEVLEDGACYRYIAPNGNYQAPKDW